MNGSNNGNSLNFTRIDAICSSSPLLIDQGFSPVNTYDTETFAHVLASMFPNLAPTLFGDASAASSCLSKTLDDKELSKYCSLFDESDRCDGDTSHANTSSSPSFHQFAAPSSQASPARSSYERYFDISSSVPRSSTVSDEQSGWLEGEHGPRSPALSIRRPPSPIYVEDLFELSEPVYTFIDSTEPLDYGDSPVPSLAHSPTESCESPSEGPVTPSDGPIESHTALDGEQTSLCESGNDTDVDVEKLPASDIAQQDAALESVVCSSTCSSPSASRETFLADDRGCTQGTITPDDANNCEVPRKDATTSRSGACPSPALSYDVVAAEDSGEAEHAITLSVVSDSDNGKAQKIAETDASRITCGASPVGVSPYLDDCREVLSDRTQEETCNAASDCHDHGASNDDEVNLAVSERVSSTLLEERPVRDNNPSTPSGRKRRKKRKRTMGEYAQSFVPSPSRPAFYFPVRATQRSTNQLEVTHVPLDPDDVVMLSSMRGDDGRCKFSVLKDGVRTRCNQELVKDNSLLYAHFAIHYHDLEYYSRGADFKPVCPWCDKRPTKFGGLNRHIVYTELKVNSDMCDCGGWNSRSNQKNNANRHENSAMHRAYVRCLAEQGSAREVGSNSYLSGFALNPEGREFVEGSSRETKRTRLMEQSEAALLL